MRQLAPGVWEKTDFFSAEETDQLVNSAECNDRWGLAKVGKFNHQTLLVDELVDRDHRDARVLGFEQIPEQCAYFETAISERALAKIYETWSLADLDIAGTQYVRYDLGGKFNAHRDWGQAFRNRCISLIVYLNDAFDGGELAFPEIDFEYRPRKSSLLMFPSEYLHASLPLRGGSKLIFLSFLCSRAG